MKKKISRLSWCPRGFGVPHMDRTLLDRLILVNNLYPPKLLKKKSAREIFEMVKADVQRDCAMLDASKRIARMEKKFWEKMRISVDRDLLRLYKSL